MSKDPDSHEPGVAHPRKASDSLVEPEDPEEDGVGNSEEVRSWLPNGSAPVSTGGTADAGSEAPHASTENAPGGPAAASAAFTAASPFVRQDLYGQEESHTSSLGQEGSAMASAPYGFGEAGYTPGPAPEQAEAPVSAQYSYDQSGGTPGYTSGGYTVGQSGGTAGYTVPPPRAAATVAPSQRRRANLVVARLEPWSVMKFSFLMSLVAWVVLFVAVALLYFMLSSLGVFHAIQTTLSGVTSSQGSGGFDLGSYLSASKVLGYTMLIGAVNVILITVLSTIGAMIYNVVTHLGGGIEVTLRETD
jgi:hypothetical protein